MTTMLWILLVVLVGIGGYCVGWVLGYSRGQDDQSPITQLLLDDHPNCRCFVDEHVVYTPEVVEYSEVEEPASGAFACDPPELRQPPYFSAAMHRPVDMLDNDYLDILEEDLPELPPMPTGDKTIVIMRGGEAMSDKPLSERLQVIADHLRGIFPETYRQCDHLDMLVPELVSLEAQVAALKEAGHVYRKRVIRLLAKNEALKQFIHNIRPVLEAAEWENGFCPECCMSRERGHSVTCWMAYAIAEAKRLVPEEEKP